MHGAATTHEIVFIDPSVEDLPELLAGLRADVRAAVLRPDRPALPQMAAALAEGGWTAAHLIAHGAPGEVRLGGETLHLDALAAASDDLAEIGRALGPEGSLLLWSCEVAAGDRGADFIDALAQAGGAHVAASRGLIGQARRGGAWALDQQTAAVVARPR